MKNTELRYVTQERAAALLGIPVKELSRISEESGLGHKERAGNQRCTPAPGRLPPATRGFSFDTRGVREETGALAGARVWRAAGRE